MFPERVHVPASLLVTAVGFRTPAIVRTVDPEVMLPVTGTVALLRVTLLPLTAVIVVPATIPFPLIEAPFVMPIVEPRFSVVLPPV